LPTTHYQILNNHLDNLLGTQNANNELYKYYTHCVFKYGNWIAMVEKACMHTKKVQFLLIYASFPLYNTKQKLNISRQPVFTSMFPNWIIRKHQNWWSKVGEGEIKSKLLNWWKKFNHLLNRLTFRIQWHTHKNMFALKISQLAHTRQSPLLLVQVWLGARELGNSTLSSMVTKLNFWRNVTLML
jgi:hypothetical protein